jgi:hypothetical protein
MIRISALATRGHRIDATTYFRQVRAALLELGDEESALPLHDHLFPPAGACGVSECRGSWCRRR